jgi:hypothetical protein
MKKFALAVFIAVLLLSIVTDGYCVNKIKWGRVDTYKQLKRQLPNDFFYFGQDRTGVSTMITGNTEVPLNFGIVKLPLTGTKSITIANGTPGQMITLLAVNGGSTTTTLTPATSYGWSSATFDAAGESLTLRYLDDTFGWLVDGAVGATVIVKDEGE